MPKEYSAEPCPRCLKERADGTLGENYRCEACRILFFEWKLSEKDKTIKHLDIELKKKERKIKSFCKNDCDGGKEMGLCECCSLGTLLDSPKPSETVEQKHRSDALTAYGYRKPEPSEAPALIGTVGKDSIPVNCNTYGQREHDDVVPACRGCVNCSHWKPKPSTDPIDPNFPKCAGCRRASHNAHCGLAITGKCNDGSMYEVAQQCPRCDGKLIGKYDEDGKLIGRFCENCSYTEGDA